METTRSLRAVQIFVFLLLVLVAIGSHALESRGGVSRSAVQFLR